MKRAIIALCLATAAAAAYAQQITRVAVIDLQKVYMTYYKDSASVRSFEEQKLKVQAEIARLNGEVTEMQRKRLELAAAGDATALKAFDLELYKKAQFLSDYVKVKQAELDAKAESLSKGDSFAQLLYRAVQSTAEAEGYSIVISSKDASSVGSSVIWFSPMIDITDKVIQSLLGS